MPRKDQGWITFQSSEEERRILDEYCQRSQRTKTEILRELVRGLNRQVDVSDWEELEADSPLLETDPEKPLEMHHFSLSARNLLRAKIRRVTIAGVNAEISLAIAPGVELTSTITRASAERLNLSEGKEVYAIIKSSNVIIAAVPGQETQSLEGK